MRINALFCSRRSNYIPEVRIMSIPNLRYMKVSTALWNRKGENRSETQACMRVYVRVCVCVCVCVCVWRLLVFGV